MALNKIIDCLPLVVEFLRIQGASAEPEKPKKTEPLPFGLGGRDMVEFDDGALATAVLFVVSIFFYSMPPIPVIVQYVSVNRVLLGSVSRLIASFTHGHKIADKKAKSIAKTLSSSNPDGCKLQVTAAEEEKQLKVAYSFSNGAIHNAYLFNRLFTDVLSREGKVIFQTSPDLAWITVDNDATAAKNIAPVPPLMKVEKRNVPCVAKVVPQGQFEESVILSLPLKPVSPYRHSDASHLQTAKDRNLFFELGYFIAPPEGDRLVREVNTAQGLGLRFDPFPFTSQRTLRVGPLLQVPSLALK